MLKFYKTNTPKRKDFRRYRKIAKKSDC